MLVLKKHKHNWLIVAHFDRTFYNLVSFASFFSHILFNLNLRKIFNEINIYYKKRKEKEIQN